MEATIFERQLSNGSWDEETGERLEMFLDKVLAREIWYAPRQKREPMTTREQVVNLLVSQPGAAINYGDDWYSCLRVRPAPRPAPVYDYPTGRKISCGCTVYNQIEVMSASMGTSCSYHYDRMSN